MIIQGDCLEEMKKMNDCSIDFIVTDSPYGISFMSKKWDREIPPIEYWKEMLRICKPGSFIAAAGLPRMIHRLTCAIEDAGWIIRDMVMHLFGSGFPKSHNHFGLEGYGSALKPAWEGWVLAMKPLDGTYKQNVEKWGLGGLNIDGSRISISDHVNYESKQNHDSMGYNGAKNTVETNHYSKLGRWPANLILDEEAAEMLDQMTGNNVSRFFKKIDSECFLCYNPCIKAKDKECNHIHAQDANLFSNNMPLITESIVPKNVQMMQEEQIAQNAKYVANLCEKCAMNIAHALVEIKSLDSKIEELQVILDYIGNFKKCILIQNLVLFAEQWENIDTIPTIENLSKLFGCVLHAIESYTRQESPNRNGKKEQLRSIYTPKASSKERNSGLEGMEKKEAFKFDGGPKINQWTGRLETEQKMQNFHPTVKPLSLMRYILKLLAPPNNPLVLDPFAGSGSTLCAAKQLGIRHIGIELEKYYCDISQKRLDNAKEGEHE